MSSDLNLVLQLVILVVLIAVNAFFAASEIAIISVNDNKLKKMSEDGDKKAEKLVQLIAQPSSFLATIQVGVTLSGFFASAVASESFSTRIIALFAKSSISPTLIRVLSVTVITLLLSYFTLVFGELVPKRIAMQNAEGIALRVAGTLNVIAKIFRPFVALLAVSTNSLVRMFGFDPNKEVNNVTEEEIRMMVDVGEESGVIEESEKEMINNVFEFNDRTAGEIMTHRTEISAVESTATLDEVVEIGLNEGFSRIPVYDDDLDNIIGILYVKDFLKYVGMQLSNSIDIKSIMRPPLFVPETKHCLELFKVLREKKLHMAVVIDEYGGTAGIVTMEDLLESIVGNIQDEYDHEEAEYSVNEDSTFTIEGTTDIEEVSRLLGEELPAGDYDTIGGLIIERLGRIPHEDEHPSVVVSDFTFKVEQVEDRRIVKVRATKNPPAGESINT